MQYTKLISEDDAFEVLKKSLNARFIAVDTETEGLNIRDGRHKMQGVSISYRLPNAELESIYFPFFHYGGNNYNFDRFRPVLQRLIDSKPTIYHNAKFDLVSLGTRGLDAYDSNFYDTMLLAHQVSESVPYSKKLDACAKHYLNKDTKKMKGSALEKVVESVGWGMVPAGLMADYASYDTDLTYRLFEVLWPMVVKEGTEANWKHRREVVKLLVKMERNGVKIDTDLCELLAEKGEREMERIIQELHGAPTGKYLEDLILNKLGLPPQYNFDKKTKKLKDRPTFDAKAMEVYEVALSRRNDTTAQQILTYRGWQKAVSSNYKSYLDFLSPDGRLRPNYRPDGTKTGRFSCAEPNLQQIPRGGIKPWNGKMKSCFIGEPGYVLLEADYKQLEFRLSAAYAQESALLAAFNDPDRDIFDEMTLELNSGLPADRKMERDDTKVEVYTISYGGGANRISVVFNVSKAKAREQIDHFYDTYPQLRLVQKLAEQKALQNGRVKLWSGRYRHFQYPQSEAFKAFNSAIQGGAADIVERTMLRCDDSGLNNDECRMLLQVHDSIVFEVRQDLVHLYAPRIKFAMESVDARPYSDRVKFGVDLHLFGKKESLQLVAA